MAKDGRDLPRHAMMSPEIWTMRDRLVVNVDDAVGSAINERYARLAIIDFDNASAVVAEPQFGAAGQHTVTFNHVNHFFGDGDIRRQQAGTAIRRAADYGLLAV